MQIHLTNRKETIHIAFQVVLDKDLSIAFFV